MRSFIRAGIAVLVIGLFAAPAANASPLSMLYAPLHLHGNVPASQSFVKSHFPTVTVSPGQLSKGWRSQTTGLYVKGTRSPVGTYPSSWYLHTAGGARIHDAVFHSMYVMNPGSAGWRQQVARNCAGSPQFCFLDGMGTSGFGRMLGRPSISKALWVAETIGEANYVESASSKWRVVANNLITARNPKFQVGFEMFGRVGAAQSLAVLRSSNCLCFAKFGTESTARYAFALFLLGAGAGDHISVGTDAQVGKWWDFFNQAAKLGNPTSSAITSGGQMVRHYSGGKVVVNLRSRSGSIVLN
jgi:hypothetical protein